MNDDEKDKRVHILREAILSIPRPRTKPSSTGEECLKELQERFRNKMPDFSDWVGRMLEAVVVVDDR